MLNLCSKCKNVLSPENSVPSTIKKGSGYCRNCKRELGRAEYRRNLKKRKETNKANYGRNPERYKEASKKRGRSLKGRFTELKRSLKIDGTSRYDLLWHYNFYAYFMADAVCHYCSGPLNSYGHSLDRIDNAKKHEANNVVPCCGQCNSIKSWFWGYNDMMLVAP